MKFKDDKLNERYVKVSFYELDKLVNGVWENIQPVLITSFDNLHVNFNITKTRGATLDEADLEIYGLSRNLRNSILTMQHENFNSVSKRYGISIDAGYVGENIGTIFSGDIMEAMPQNTAPDLYLKVNAKTNFYGHSIVGAVVLNGNINLKDIAAECAKELNLTLKYNTSYNPVINSFIYNEGNLNGLALALESLAKDKILINFDDIFLTVSDYVPPQTEPKKVNAQNGMVGIPNITYNGVSITTMLNPAYKTGDWIEYTSELVPNNANSNYQYNGRYNVSILNHTGGLRSNNFYTILQCMLYDAEANKGIGGSN
jgi:hypothetical protein